MSNLVNPYFVDGKFSCELNYVYRVSQGLSMCVRARFWGGGGGGCKLQLNIKKGHKVTVWTT